jgi:molybdopterin molybdotransferase
MEDFFDVKTVEEARRILISAWLQTGPRPLGTEQVDLLDSAGRILALDIASPENVPPYHRSTVDGYAVAAKDTFGASEALPAMLDIIEDIPMGVVPRKRVQSGQSSRIPTGGVLPAGADACVMVEHTELLDDRTVLVRKPVSPGENAVQPGEDIHEGETLLRAGRLLSPYDVGALAALGADGVRVLQRPQVALISTGDEIVPPPVVPAPGQVRDVNTYSLASALKSLGAEPLALGIAPDTYSGLRSIVEKGLGLAHAVVVSGGSSVGERDITVRVFSDLGPPGVLVHGVAVKPGKPVILGICRGKPVFGLPGHPVSALVAFDLFVRYTLDTMLARAANQWTGEVDQGVLAALSAARETQVTARLSRNVASAPGRQDHVRVSLVSKDGELVAEPVLGKSGLISTMVRSDGEIVIPLECEGLVEGSLVQVRVARPTRAQR